jgi:hypothetical protein
MRERGDMQVEVSSGAEALLQAATDPRLGQNSLHPRSLPIVREDRCNGERVAEGNGRLRAAISHVCRPVTDTCRILAGARRLIRVTLGLEGPLLDSDAGYDRDEEECMRRVSYGGVVVVMSFVLAFGALAAPREQRSSREKQNPVVRAVKRIIQALGDGLIIPTP